jgi:tetratricopeptide (TPR) repeat protein
MHSHEEDDLFVARLSDFLDDEEIGAAERAEIEAHLATCATCRTVLAELRGVAARARALPDAPPAADLWPGVAERLQPPSVRPFVTSRARRFSFTLPQLVAAGLALMVLSGGMVWVARLGDPRTSLPPVAAGTDLERQAPEPAPVLTSFDDSHYDQAIADLQKILETGRSRLDADTIRVIEDNLATIDQAIEQSRKALRSDPANVYLNNHFAASRSRKLALLRRASALTMARATEGGSE